MGCFALEIKDDIGGGVHNAFVKVGRLATGMPYKAHIQIIEIALGCQINLASQIFFRWSGDID